MSFAKLRKAIAVLGVGFFTLLLTQLEVTEKNGFTVISLLSAAAEEAKPQRRVRRAQTLRPVIYEKLEQARLQADEDDYQGALATLTSLEKRRRNSYETAMTHNMFAYIYVNQDQLALASERYQQVVAIGNIPDSLKQSTLYSLAKLYLMDDQFSQALVAINQWFDLVEKPTTDGHILRAQISFQLEDYKLAQSDIKIAIESKRETTQPPENWLLLERAVLYQLKDYKELSRCLEDLVSFYSKSDYWVQLAAVYSELGQADKELTTLETAYDQGLLNQSTQLINFAQALLSQDIPYKAAKVILLGLQDKTIKSSARIYSLLGDAWMIAKEYDQAIVAITTAAEVSQKGEDYYKLAQIHTERQEWQKVIMSSQKALTLGDLSAEGQVHILAGLAHFYSQSLDNAIGSFERAMLFDSVSESASQWLKFIDNERARLEYIANSY